MKRGLSFTPDGPLTLGDLRVIAASVGTDADDDRIVEIRTPMAGDRRAVTLTVTSERWQPPPPPAPEDTEPTTTTEGNQ